MESKLYTAFCRPHKTKLYLVNSILNCVESLHSENMLFYIVNFYMNEVTEKET